MSHSLFPLAAAGVSAALLLAAPALARDYDVGPLHIAHPWARPTPPGAPTAAGYLSVTNHGATPDHLLGGASAAFKQIKVHEMSMTGQIMRMRPIAGGLEIKPGQTVVLTPGGDRHLMLIAPKQPLKLGDRIPATLQFEKAGAVKVIFTVQDVAGRAAAPMSGMEMH